MAFSYDKTTSIINISKRFVLVLKQESHTFQRGFKNINYKLT